MAQFTADRRRKYCQVMYHGTLKQQAERFKVTQQRVWRRTERGGRQCRIDEMEFRRSAQSGP